MLMLDKAKTGKMFFIIPLRSETDWVYSITGNLHPKFRDIINETGFEKRFLIAASGMVPLTLGRVAGPPLPKDTPWTFDDRLRGYPISDDFFDHILIKGLNSTLSGVISHLDQSVGERVFSAEFKYAWPVQMLPSQSTAPVIWS